MRPIVVSVGPLAAASVTAISASQGVPAAAALVIDGTLASGYSANNIAQAQAVAGAGALTLNGSLVVGGTATPTRPARIVVASTGNDTGITFTVAGLSSDGVTALSETIAGANASRTSTKNLFYKVSSVTASGAAAANVSVGTNGTATLDKPRRITIVSAGNDSAVNFAITGTNHAGNDASETLAGANAGTATSVLDYATVTKITASAASASTLTVGSSTVAASAWVAFDPWAKALGFAQCAVSGTVNYTLETSQDDPNSPSNPVSPASMTWDSSASPSSLVGATATISAFLQLLPAFARIKLNSGTGSVTATFTQSGAVEF